MPKRSSKKKPKLEPEDFAQAAVRVMQTIAEKSEKDHAAVALSAGHVEPKGGGLVVAADYDCKFETHEPVAILDWHPGISQ